MSLELRPKQQSVVDIINDCPEADTIYLIEHKIGKTDIGGMSQVMIFVTYFEKILDGAS